MISQSSSVLSQRILSLEESATIAMARRARELKNSGRDIVSLTLGEPDFDTPQYIREAAKEAIDQGYTHYTPVPGYLDLREAISRKFARENNLDYAPDQIVVSTGAKQSIANAVFCTLNPGEEVILPSPYWVSYEAMVQLAEGRVKRVPSSIESDFKMRPDELRAALNESSKVLLFSSPCNPSGSVYSKEELEALAEVILEHPRLVVISDEIYEHIQYKHSHVGLASIDGMYDRVITVNGLSKAYAMTGWRLGYMAAPRELAAACTKFQGQFTSATCSITQRAAITALDGPQVDRKQMTEAFKTRRALFGSLLRENDQLKVNEPEGAFYFFPDFSAYFGLKKPDGTVLDNSAKICAYLLEDYGLATVPGGPFGSPNCIRLSYAASEESLREAASRLKAALSALQS